MLEVFLVLIENPKLKYSVKSDRTVAHKSTQVFLDDNKRNKLLKACVIWISYSWIHKNMKIAPVTRVRSPLNSAVVTDLAFHSTNRKGYQSKLLVVHSKGGRCNFWCLFPNDDQISPWWASRDGPRHDLSHSDTMIWIKFNSYASLVIWPYIFHH